MDEKLDPIHLSNIKEGQLSDLCESLRNDIVGVLNNEKVANTLEKKKTAYNQFVDALRSRQSWPRVDPLQKLPNEIFTKILLQLMARPQPGYTRVFTEPLLPLTMVSRKWRNFLLSEPSLWNEIDLDKKNDRDAIVCLQLKLSRDLPLDLVIPIPIELWGNIRPNLQKNRDRIESIVFIGNFTNSMPNYHKIGSEIRSFLGDLCPLPRLRRIVHLDLYTEGVYDIQWIVDSFPSLTELEIPLTSDELQATKDILHITSLTTFDDPKIVMPIAQTIETLRKVRFDMKSLNSRKDINKVESSRDIGWTSQLDWTELHWTKTYPVPLFLLKCLSRLVSIYITADIQTFNGILNSIDHLSVLKSFRIDIYIHNAHSLNLNEPSRLEAPHLIRPNFNVDSLVITIRGYEDGGGEEEEGIQDDKSPEVIGAMVELLLYTMPNVQHLDIGLVGRYFRRPEPLPRLFLDRHFNGRDLALSFVDVRFLPIEEGHIPPSVHTLQILAGRDSMCALSSNFVKYLRMLPKDSWSNNDPKLMIDLSTWPGLECIHADSDNVYWIQWDKASLAHLRCVSITVAHSGDITAGTFFINTIACNTNSYPSLEEIRLDRCPEWDILMIMLERRNLLASPNTKRIKRLSIPEICPPGICRVIHTFLQGKWPERPSNWELSMAANADIMEDITM
jgi:hypothetical protein